MSHEQNLSRRDFLSVAAAATTFSILPRHVLGGPFFTAPADRINLALIGSGTMGLNMLMSDWLPREDLHITCVCDPNTDSTDYRDWSKNGLRNRIREFTGLSNWDENGTGIRAGREVGRTVVEAYYGKSKPSGNYQGCRTYADYRELLERESDLDGVLIMTPEHLHATIAIAAMNRGKHAISHKTLANVMQEVRLAVDTARKSNVTTHLLAWHNLPSMYTIQDWIKAGAIGRVREVHNWSNRPVWPQGWLDYPADTPPIPAGLDWPLWLGPVPDRPYHPDYTHALFRGWYDFGSGCLGDMGNYSLWQVYRILDLKAPVSVEATPCTGAQVVDGVSGRKVTNVAFPHASTIRFRHATSNQGPIEIWWYDGGMRPPTPSVLYDARQEFAEEGLMFVGDEGIILGDFRGLNPQIYPESRMREFEKSEVKEGLLEADEEYVQAMKEGRRSQGSFENVAPLAEATCLGRIALQVGHRLDWDSEKMEITNLPEANRYLRREYRSGWELV